MTPFRFLRQVVSIPYVVSGMVFTTLGDFFTDLGTRIEGADSPLSAHPLIFEEEESHDTPDAA